MQVVAAIDAVDMQGGSIAGGQAIHIKGRGFGRVKSAVKVDAGGVPCTVMAAEDNEIVCILKAGNHTSRELYRGGAGVKMSYIEGAERPCRFCTYEDSIAGPSA